jgi:serine phosphatase RsbU (regulator of sigma subunit)
MKRIISLVFCILLTFSLLGQSNQYGNHFIKNYNQEDYSAGPQNYSIAQDKRGVVYAGNQGNILEYDGEKWNHIKINNNSFVKSLAVNTDGTVYAGATGDFGYLKPDKTGELKYVSLSQNIDSSFQDVFNIYTHKDLVYFSTFKYIFKFREDSLLKIIPVDIGGLHFWDYLVDSTLYVTNYQEGLMKIEDEELINCKGGDFYQKMDIFFILPFRENQLLVGSQNELFIYDPQNGESHTIGKLGKGFKKLNDYVSEVQLYGGLKLSDGNLLIHTIDDGLVIIDKDSGEFKFHYTDKNGLLDNTVIDVFENQRGNLWLGLNTGIANIEYNSPLLKFDNEDGLKSIKVDLVRFREKIFVASNVHTYQQFFDKKGLPYFEKLPKISQGRKFLVFNDPYSGENKLLIGAHTGIFDITNTNNIFNINYGNKKDRLFKTNYIIQSKFFPGRLYAGTTSGFVSFKYTPDGWKFLKEDNNIDDNIKFLAEENDSTLWAATEINGLYKIILDTEQSTQAKGRSPELKTIHYDTSKGLPANNYNRLFKIEDELVFTTTQGFYQYDNKNDKFKPDTTIFNGHYNNKKISFLKKDDEGFFWVLYFDENEEENIEKVYISEDSLIIDDTPFKRITNTDFYGIYNEPGPISWIIASKNIYSFNNSYNKEYNQKYYALIRNVSLTYDSLLFKGTFFSDTNDFTVGVKQPDLLVPKLTYRHNNIAFKFSSPYFEYGENVRYSYKLEGYDEKWSNWSFKKTKEYTNLDAGRYTFRVKAKNIYGVESETGIYTFVVLPPWYQTIWAYLLYLIAAVTLVILIVKWYTRHLEKEKIRLEKIVQERTKEVVAQKDQIEQQRDEIAKKNRDITDSIEYASKIQTAVLPSEEFTDKNLPEHFVFFRPRDIVSGDFYWIDRKNGLVIVIAADCTGHGVPGAFMSMLGVSLLNEIVNKHETTQANLILNELRDEVKRTLRQTGKEGEAKDGMDIALAVLDLNNMKMEFAGAYNPLYFFRNGELHQYKADRMPIGIYIREKPTFTNHEIDIQKGDTFYIFSDGFQDQFGGEDGSKFKTKRLKELLAEIQDKSMEEQKKILEETFDEWKGNREQLDDVILIGVRI